MMFLTQIARIQDKLTTLKNLDIHYTTFGSYAHRYQLTPLCTAESIQQFEKRYSIQLPQEYVFFLTQVGNGSAGPYYGLVPLEKSLYEDLDYPKDDQCINPSLPFPYAEVWNLNFDDLDDETNHHLTEEYYDAKHINGSLRIANYGCGIFINLVVNGREYGNIWMDDRGNDGGIFPVQGFGNINRITFLDWYELWLDNSLAKLAEQTNNQKRQCKALKSIDML